VAGSNGLTSLFRDCKIGTRVGLGFTCVLAILAIVSAMAYFGFRAAEGGFASTVQRVKVVSLASDVDRSFLNLRRLVRTYTFTGLETNIGPVKQEEVTLRGLSQQGMILILNQDRRAKLQDITGLSDSYMANFDHVVTLTREQTKLLRGSLDPLGQAQDQNFEALIAAAAATGDTTVTKRPGV
jgi:hypothetical protein